MKYSRLQETAQSNYITTTFQGYNHQIKIDDAEFYDMKNMTSSFYPLLSPRGKRGVFTYPGNEKEIHKINGMINKDVLCYVDGTDVYIGDAIVNGLVVEDSKKHLVSMGAYLIIFPDKVYVNTQNLSDYGSMENSYQSEGPVRFEMCNLDGEAYKVTYTGKDVPKNPNNLEYWIDTSSTPHSLKVYNASTSMWTAVATSYVKIMSKDIAKGFSKYDGVQIDGISKSLELLSKYNKTYSILYDVYRDELNNGEKDYVIVIGFIDEVYSQTAPVSMERKIPNFDYVTESSNRLWGCRYGKNLNGDIVNEIYACKLGDFKNWNCFMGMSTDSYTASCGTDGPWTGAVTHMGYPIFFKENVFHKVYGNYPSNYQIQTTECRGVVKGADKSLAIVNESLFYKSRNGICVYDGSLPTEIASPFGDIRYTDAVAGAVQNKYYVSMKSDKDGSWNLFVYDTMTNMLHKEDDLCADAFCSCNGELYYTEPDGKQIYTILGSGELDERPVEWMVESGILGTVSQASNGFSASPNKKYVSGMVVRIAPSVGSRVHFYIQYDSCGEWEHVYAMDGTSLRTFSVPVRPKRCDHFRLRITGVGDAKIHSITRIYENGGY